MNDDDLERFSDDEGNPVAKVGLRSLREERAPESSLKATLDALRGAPPPAQRRNDVATFLIWALIGGAIAAVIAWLLFFR